VIVDTSSISGTAGSLDFQFNPGPSYEAAFLQILSFASGGTLAGGPTLTGDVSGGPLPATTTFDNGTAYNDYFEGFTYGSSISFDVSLYGPALSSPDDVSTSAFAFSMFSDAAGTIPALTSDTTDGFAFSVDVNPDGTTTVSNFSSQTSVQPASSAAPEPGSLILMETAMALMVMLLRFQKKRGDRTVQCAVKLAIGVGEGPVASAAPVQRRPGRGLVQDGRGWLNSFCRG
jgi:hypothetical protein